jgi:8-oxo-dGTP diphosphatase
MNFENYSNVAAAFFPVNRKLLVMQRSQTGKEPLKWELPGGKLHDGEEFDTALIREIKEELDITIEVIQEVGSVEIITEDHILMIIFILIKGDSTKIKLKIHENIKFVSFDELKKLDLCEADKKFVADYENEIKKYID